ncbi:hypothetical protein Dda_0988 [Drechslerella dactyloides]|uniref:FUN14 family protein n=1 Tax=Drechslerella dactyloides TaxID=74499 RepID=A0AAD6NNT9_DREDA|nr:hypothetical protein Dda_0988 [Drechslerella dactyloides]
MAAFLRRPVALRVTLAFSVPTAYLSSQLLLPHSRSRILQCQAAPYLQDRISEAQSQQKARPLVANDEARSRGSTVFTPSDFRQISIGSFAGVMCGYTFGRMSRFVAIVLVAIVLVVQYAERKGFRVVPWQRFQRFIDEVDARRAVTENWAFKYSFGSAFCLSAWFAN